MSVQSYLLAAPKAELHVHLEGSIRPSTLMILAKRNGVQLPADNASDLERWFTFRDFDHFVEIYLTICSCLRRAEDYELITYELGSELARQNVKYAEVTFTPGTHSSQGVPFSTYFAGLTKGRERVLKELGIEINWVFDIVRYAKDGDYTVEVAIDGMRNGVITLGLGGPEVGYPAEVFAPYFEKALREGLHSAPHAGETDGPASIWAVVRYLGAERIGHGVRCIEDPALVRELVDRQIPLEICPISNLRLGVYPSLEEHPLRRLYESGVPITVNSDDPPLFNTDLNEQVLALSSGFGFELPTVEEILLNGVRQSFMAPERKLAMEQQFAREMAELKAVHLSESE